MPSGEQLKVEDCVKEGKPVPAIGSFGAFLPDDEDEG